MVLFPTLLFLASAVSSPSAPQGHGPGPSGPQEHQELDGLPELRGLHELRGLIGLGDQIQSGTVLEVKALGVDDHGNWSARLRILEPSGGAPYGIVRNGTLLLTRQAPAQTIESAPQSVFFSSFTTVGFQGDRVVSFGGVTNLAPSTSGSFRNGICFDTVPALLMTDSPGEPFSTEAAYVEVFANLRANDAGDVLATNCVADGAFVGEVLQSFQFRKGALVGQRTLDRAGPFVPELIDLNAHGRAVWGAVGSFGSSADEVLLDGQVLAASGDPIPGAGAFWSRFTAADLNDAGAVVLRGFSTAASFVATRDRVVARSGASVAAGSAARFRFFGDGPFASSFRRELRPRLLTDGSVVFYADVTDEDTGDSWAGLFREDELLVATGDVVQGLASAPAGASITVLGTQSGGFAVSPNGRYVLFDAALDDDPQAALCLLDRGAASLRKGALEKRSSRKRRSAALEGVRR